MDNEVYFELVSDNEVELGQQEEVLGIVAPQTVNIPLEVQFVPAENPKSPSPSPPTRSPQVLSPPQGSPLEDAPSFMGFYTYHDIVDLGQWAVHARAARVNPTIRIEEPDVSPNLKTFLRFTLVEQRESKLIQVTGKVLIEQLKAYLVGYNQLTSFSRWQWLRLLPVWTAMERREQLELFANAGGFCVP